MQIRQILSVAATALLLSACDNPFGSDSESMTVAWAGNTGGEAIEFTVAEDERQFTGSGYIRFAGRDVPIEVTGANAYPEISMTVANVFGGAITFPGRFETRDRIVGTVYGFQRGNTEAPFERQRAGGRPGS